MASGFMSSNPSDTVYTAITFAPVQGFIEKSRKLRDLYGSSFILSYLARNLCEKAKVIGNDVISPAMSNVTQGTPNQIIIKGNFPEAEARATFNEAWKTLVQSCRTTIETRISDETYTWKRAWQLWETHAWEMFWAQTDPKDAHQPDRIGDVRRRLNEIKRSRAWTGVNWTGESSTLSGGDAIAYPQMTEKFLSISIENEQQKKFFEKMSMAFSKSIIAQNELLSIPELIKRLATLENIAKDIDLKTDDVSRLSIETPTTYADINRHQDDPSKKRWTAWFQGDGDRVGEFLQNQVNRGVDESIALKTFSRAMLDWSRNLRTHLPDARGDSGDRFIDDHNIPHQKDGRIIYAGGDDFLGVLYRNAPDPKLTAQECLNWFYGFNDIWKSHKQEITVSVGFVWAAPNVPQRDVLQHCREAEQSAKDSGRDRIAIRILFNGGNMLEWTCPWWFLDVFNDYRDRNEKMGADANWNHIFEDIATLEARHAFRGNTNVALTLFELYFGEARVKHLQDEAQRWNRDGHAGILGNSDRFPTEQSKQKALNDWIINLVKAGFHLHREKPEAISSDEPPSDRTHTLKAA
jgi:CRISPR-associated protein Cmr2